MGVAVCVAVGVKVGVVDAGLIAICRLLLVAISRLVAKSSSTICHSAMALLPVGGSRVCKL